jgi:hypothetical protein
MNKRTIVYEGLEYELLSEDDGILTFVRFSEHFHLITLLQICFDGEGADFHVVCLGESEWNLIDRLKQLRRRESA